METKRTLRHLRSMAVTPESGAMHDPTLREYQPTPEDFFKRKLPLTTKQKKARKRSKLQKISRKKNR